ncbi:MAG: BatA domain-containing protein [Phycisphaerales bacterium]
MTFLHPALAAIGAACIAIPIAIHLLMRRRRQPIAWAAMRFLLEAIRQHRRRLRLEQFLLLASRCLLVLLIALALGRPMLGAAGALTGRGQTTLFLLIDNGLAGSATNNNPAGTPDESSNKPDATALDRHKAAAIRLLGQLSSDRGDRAALVALAGPCAAIIMPPSSDLAGVGEAVRALQPAQSATDIPGGLSLVRDAIEPAAAARAAAIVLSDLLVGSADVSRRIESAASPLTLLASTPSELGVDNATVTEAEPLRPLIIAGSPESGSQPFPVRVAVRRSGPWVAQPAVTSVRVGVGVETSAPAGQATIRWLPGQSEASASVTVDPAAVVRAAQSANTAMLWASIDRDAITGDDTRFRPVQVRASLRVGIVSPRRSSGQIGVQRFQAEDWLRLALAPVETSARASEIDVAEIEPLALDAARLSSLDAVVVTRPDVLAEPVWKRLRGYVDSGGLVVVVPPAGVTVHLWPDSLVAELGLPWTAARQAREITAGLAPSTEEPPTGPDDLFALVRPEFPDLLSAVRVLRVMAFEPAPGADKVTPLLRLADRSPLIVAGRPGGADRAGLVVVLGFALDFEWTDLMAKPLVVPLLNEIVRQGIGRASGAWAVVAGGVPPVPAGTVELRASTQFLAASAGRAAAPIRTAGVWRAVDERGATRGLVAINADPAAGRGEAQASSALSTWLAGLAGAPVRWLGPNDNLLSRDNSTGATLDAEGGNWAWWLLLAALAAAVLELGLARWFSHAVIKSEPAR